MFSKDSPSTRHDKDNNDHYQYNKQQCSSSSNYVNNKLYFLRVICNYLITTVIAQYFKQEIFLSKQKLVIFN